MSKLAVPKENILSYCTHTWLLVPVSEQAKNLYGAIYMYKKPKELRTQQPRTKNEYATSFPEKDSLSSSAGTTERKPRERGWWMWLRRLRRSEIQVEH